MPDMRDRFVSVASSLLDESSRVAVVLADIGAAQFAAAGVPDRHPGRFINVGIREQLMIGVGAGLALEGFLPIIHSYAPFLVERPFEQVKLDFEHQGLTGILVSVGASVDAAPEGRTHQAPEDVALMLTLPGWDVFVPGHADEVETIMRRAVSSGRSSYIRLSALSNRRETRTAVSGWAVVRRGGRRAPVCVAIGPMLDALLESTADLDATVLYAVAPRPDEELLKEIVTGDAIVVAEPYQAGTTVAGLTTALADRPCRYLSLGVPTEEPRRYGTPHDHLSAAGLDAHGLRRSITTFLRK